ncbi:MAG: prolipoprotein diacylglyceryl transferase [Alphaproteobacteria bacterium]|nr:prolipoprotein diacylglyceryl transferase [Alphaproteobacteria bacterium]
MAITIDPISPVAFSLAGLSVRWYALAYIAGFVLGYLLYRRMLKSPKSLVAMNQKQLDDLLTAVIMGVIIGGRLGYVLVYNPLFFILNPLEILAVWHGGMSFHGGLIGVMIAVWLFARKNKIRTFSILDMLTVVTPIGLFFGRIANFVNMELMGAETSVPWAVKFGENAPALHPSPIYEALGEGAFLFALMSILYRFTNLRKYPGALSGIMGMAYAVVRIVCEQFRMPDVQIGFLTSWGLTMGMLLSGIMFVAGAIVFTLAIRKK